MKNPKLIWTIIRMLTFATVGILNTVLIKTEDIGSWKNYVGYLFLALAIYDIVILILYFRKIRRH